MTDIQTGHLHCKNINLSIFGPVSVVNLSVNYFTSNFLARCRTGVFKVWLMGHLWPQTVVQEWYKFVYEAIFFTVKNINNYTKYLYFYNQTLIISRIRTIYIRDTHTSPFNLLNKLIHKTFIYVIYFLICPPSLKIISKLYLLRFLCALFYLWFLLVCIYYSNYCFMSLPKWLYMMFIVVLKIRNKSQ